MGNLVKFPIFYCCISLLKSDGFLPVLILNFAEK